MHSLWAVGWWLAALPLLWLRGRKYLIHLTSDKRQASTMKIQERGNLLRIAVLCGTALPGSAFLPAVADEPTGKPAAPAAAPPAAPAAAPAPAGVTAPSVAADADVSKGVLYGKVVDVATGQPIADATVAVQDKDGKVVAWTKTNTQGQYALAADSLSLLQLRPSKRGGLLSGLARGVGKAVTAPVKIAADVAKSAANTVAQIDPLQTAKSAVVATVTANPAPVVAQVTGSAVAATKNEAAAKLKDAPANARERAVRSMLGERQATPKAKREALAPGEVRLMVSAPNYKALKSKAGTYWLEPPGKQEDKAVGAQAWLETAKLAPAAGDRASEVEEIAVLLAEPKIDPDLAAQGTTVKISVNLQAPSGTSSKVRVFAREDKKRQVVELKAKEEGVFMGELALDPATPVGDTIVTVVALRAEPVEVSLRDRKDDPLLDFAQRLDDMDADKPYEFDPRIMASENRLDLPLTILDIKQATPPASTAPAAAANPEQPAPAAPQPTAK